ncbi:MAG: cupin domain-containing protein [Chloroflexi bacterium]|jgi:mannose-6-phosphate isomerase-like protein (cupin superfamily)|nr:cupin domain-containing protein [Chloroflexota bacterium]
MFARRLTEVEPFQCAGIDFGMLLPRDVTDSVEIVLAVLKPGMESPVDQHATFDQVFWIIEGEGDLTIGAERALVGPQTVAFIPRDTPHTIKCVSGSGLKYLYLNVWGKGVPELERLWRKVYLNVHARRTAAAPPLTRE